VTPPFWETDLSNQEEDDEMVNECTEVKIAQPAVSPIVVVCHTICLSLGSDCLTNSFKTLFTSSENTSDIL
jgi:hypothetical protein